MKKIYMLCLMLMVSTFSVSAQPVRTVTNAEQLQDVFHQPLDSLQVYLLPGDYHLQPTTLIDSTCGNCEDPATPVEVTVGLHIRGKRVLIAGTADQSATIYTHAGYGIFFDECEDCAIENLVITGGERDADGNATDAAIVVKNSKVTIQKNRIIDNIGDSTQVNQTIVGIMGIAGRENSLLTIHQNEIIRNSWDGIALYRNASAHITQNVIDGVDKAVGQRVGGGRGVGIGVTWNADAIIEENLVRRYWKGIGLFVDANGIVRRNIVENIVTWGISLWDAGKGKPIGMIKENIIYQTGACGAAITRRLPGQMPGAFSQNIVIETGQNEKYDSSDRYCDQCALALQIIPENFSIENNAFYNNRRATDDLPNYDQPHDEFMTFIDPICQQMRNHPVLRNASFIINFCTSE